MRKTIASFLITFLLAQSIQAQDISEKSGAPSVNKTENPDKGKSTSLGKNIFKINLTAIPLKNYSFQYERVITRKFSVALGFRTMPASGLPMRSSIENAVGSDDEQTLKTIRSTKIGNTAVTPEVRFYLSKKGYGRGFYVAPYYRYSKFVCKEIPVEYDGTGGQVKTITMKGDMTSHCGGLMLGAQWTLSKSVSLDWWIVGAQYGKAKGTFTGISDIALTQAEQDDIKETIDGLDIPFGNFKYNVTSNGVTGSIDGPWGGLRSGITIGIRF